MKREDIKKQIPSITGEQLDWLMGEHGRDVTAEKSKLTPLQEQLTTLTGQLKTAQDGLKAFEGVNVDDLKGEITKLQGEMAAQADRFAFDTALDGAIRDASGKSVKAIRGMLDMDALQASKNRSEDIKTALDALARENAWAAPNPGHTRSIHHAGGNRVRRQNSEKILRWLNLSGIPQRIRQTRRNPHRTHPHG